MNIASEFIPVPTPLRVKIIGLGGAGGNVVEHLAQSGFHEHTCAVVQTDARAFELSTCASKVLVGEKVFFGLGAGGDIEQGRLVAETAAPQLKPLCADAELIIIITGLGGGTGTGMAPVLARLAKESGALVLALATLPFDFEGPRREAQARAGLQRLRTVADGVICLHNQRVCKLLDENARAVAVFGKANELMGQGVRGLCQMLARRGLINVDFADLAAALRGRHAESCFARVETAGEHRGRAAIDNLLAHPLLESGQAIADADTLLVTVLGGPDLGLGEISQVSERLQCYAEKAQLILGASIVPEMEGRLALTVVAARQGSVDAIMPPKPAPQETTSSVTQDSPIETQFFAAAPVARPASRFVPPAPELPAERKDQLFAEQNKTGRRGQRGGSRLRQGQLPLEIISKGRFEKSEPTIHHGEDLDVPTYIRRGIKLN